MYEPLFHIISYQIDLPMIVWKKCAEKECILYILSFVYLHDILFASVVYINTIKTEVFAVDIFNSAPIEKAAEWGREEREKGELDLITSFCFLSVSRLRIVSNDVCFAFCRCNH